MTITFDFKIHSSDINGVTQVQPLNEDALNYLVDEVQFTVMADGTAPLFEDAVGDFISDASWAHLCCEYV